MKTSIKIVCLCAVMVIAGAIVMPVFAENSSEHGRGRGEHLRQMETVFKELNLTAEQQEQIRQSRNQNRGQAKDLRKQIKEKRQALKAELDKTTLDESQVNSIASQLKQLEAQAVDLRVERMVQMKKILTPEQYQALEKKAKAFRNKSTN